jgi:hypothetical protein
LISASTPQPAERRRLATILSSVALGVSGALLGLFAAVAVEAQPRTPGRVAAIFPPWWSSARIFGAAGTAGDIAGAGGAPFIVILRGDPAQLSERAREAGALLLLDPALAGVCARPSSLDATP